MAETDRLGTRIGKFLHEVERDTKRAEEYYGRAILANPGDGEVVSLYGNLIWEKHRDESRAKSYFDRVVNASPDDW
ncbi:Tetratricopeptide-like helical [Corchorus olitorius]|uniref:Tetratricopeptide-like helical n=1 Tax=Corchorus olitorius TaxID=93759 RepID=A0A1R3ICW1_9ROSI|nr:Tetratricopeptide-like helical [Corchorus olitorius]